MPVDKNTPLLKEMLETKIIMKEMDERLKTMEQRFFIILVTITVGAVLLLFRIAVL